MLDSLLKMIGDLVGSGVKERLSGERPEPAQARPAPSADAGATPSQPSGAPSLEQFAALKASAAKDPGMAQTIRNAQLHEMRSQVEGLKAAKDDAVATTLALVVDWRHKLEGEGLPITRPAAVLAADPDASDKLQQRLMALMSENKHMEAAGLLPWLFSLRAEHSPEHRALIADMWKQFERGLPGVTDGAVHAADQVGRSLNVDEPARFPEGFEPG